MSEKIITLVADDSLIALQGMEAMLEGVGEIGMVVTANTPVRTIELAKLTNPKLILLDMKWFANEREGVDLIKELRVYVPEAIIIAVTAYPKLINEAKEAGAYAGVSKSIDRAQLIEVVHQAMSSETSSSATEKEMSKANVETTTTLNQIFISYSHKDLKWLQRLQVHVKPLEQLGTMVRWDDTMIVPGTKWKEEIYKALESAKVAVLLISADFLASDFITTNELPAILTAAKVKGTIILPVIISPCRYQQTESISQFQSVNSPSQPLTTLPKSRQEAILVKVSEAVEKALRGQT